MDTYELHSDAYNEKTRICLDWIADENVADNTISKMTHELKTNL